MAAVNAALSFSISSAGVPAGATTPHQVAMEKFSKPASFTVGTSGKRSERSSVVTAKALSLPLLMLLATVAKLSKVKSTSDESNAI